MIRRTSEVLRYNATDEQTITYDYGSGGFGDKVSRVLEVERSGTAVATYAYDGEAELRTMALPVVNLSNSMTTMDRFQRLTRSSYLFTGSGTSPDYFYDTTITFDRNSNITRTEDGKQVNPSGVKVFDVAYTIDGLNRVIKAQEGHWGGSSITTEARDEYWSLTQTGNWAVNQVDFNGDNDVLDPGEINDTRAHNPINEILSRNTDSAGGDEFSLDYNLRGDLEDEGGTGGFEYVWDAFGRLVELRAQGGSLLAAYRYNGLNQRITWHYDATGNGTVDGSDPTYHFAWGGDEKWRMVGTWRGSDTEPKELFVNHQAGLAGHGGSSYIDTVVLRDKDSTNGWTGLGDGIREPRHDYAQREGGWRADVSVIVDNAGDIQEWDKYRAYGVPFLLTPGDHNKDGAVTKADNDAFAADYAAGNIRADMNKSGTVTSADQTIFNDSYTKAVVGGRFKLSAPDIANRKGYAGYEHDGDLPELAHVRYRVLHFGLGRWMRRDPLGYVDGVNLDLYCQGAPITNLDYLGLLAFCARTCSLQVVCYEADPAFRHCAVESSIESGSCSQRVSTLETLDFGPRDNSGGGGSSPRPAPGADPYGCGQSPSPWGPIVPRITKNGPNLTPGAHPGPVIGSGTAGCAILDCLHAMAEVIGRACIPSTIGSGCTRNSNTALHDALSRCGVAIRRPNWALGWNQPLWNCP